MGGGGLVAVRVLVRFAVREAVEIPGFTPSFVKSLLIMGDGGGLVKELFTRGGANKPLGITPVMAGGRPILSEGRVTLKPGRTYWVGVGAAGGEELVEAVPAAALNAFGSGVCETAGAEVEAVRLEEPPQAIPKEITVKTLTPAIIEALTADGTQTLIESPTLRDILATPLRILGRVLWEAYGINIPTAWGWRIARHYAQTKSKTRTTTVNIGKGRKVRGVEGEWTFKATKLKPPKYVAAALDKALKIAKAVGIGKSRGIGFGQVKIIVRR